MLEVQGTFISQKINKIRWIPEEFGQSQHFVTGSWDDAESDSVKIWRLEGPNNNENIDVPHQAAEFKVNGDVTEIKLVQKNRIAVSTSNGDARILEFNVYNENVSLKEIYSWTKLHNFGSTQCSCTTLDTYEGELATVGEDGCINILNSHRGDVTRSLNDVDSCGIHSICFIKHTEVMTGNIRGHMKIFDLRSDTNKPTASFLLAGDELAANCLVRHPTQPYIVLAGSESGAIAIWDLRMESYPTSIVNAHNGPVNEVKFHHENSQKLLSCSAAGEFWEWNMDSMTQTTRGPDDKVAWLPTSDKSIVKVDAIIPKIRRPFNSFDCDRSRILVAGDNEAIYHIKKFKY